MHKDKHTPHSEPSRSDGCQCESSVPERGSWYHSFSLSLSVFLCHSEALRCVRSYIHHLSRASILYLAHTLKQATLLSPLLSKKLRDLVAKRPNAPLVSHLDITFISCNLLLGLCQRGDHYGSLSLHYGCAIISAGINTKDGVHGIYNSLLFQVSK